MTNVTSGMRFEVSHKGTTPEDANLVGADDIAAYMLIDSIAISTATSKAVSTVNAAAPDSSSISQAKSQAVSAAVIGTTADSKAVSVSGNTSVADSKALSVSGSTSIADSKAVSVANSVPILTVVAASQTVSTADSKAVSVAATVPGGRVVTTLATYLTDNAVYNPKDFNAVGDGVTDDTTAVQACLTAAAGKTVRFTDGTYLVYALKVSANTLVDLGNAMLKKRPATLTDQTVGQFTGDAINYWAAGYAPFFFATGNGVTIRGGTLDGNVANDTLDTGATWGLSFAANANRAGITASTNSVASCTDITIDGVRFQNMVGCAINLDLTGTVRVQNCTESGARHTFANITGDALTLTTKGTLLFTGNTTSGSRVQSTITNPTVLDRKELIVCTGNVFDERLTAFSAGCKFQDSYNMEIVGNTFINTYVKPQSASTFYGESFVCSGNTFSTSNPLLWSCGVIFGSCRMKSLTVAGNAITNGLIAVERSSDSVSVTGNTIRVNTDSRNPHSGATLYYAIAGGANQNSNISGAELVANNLIDLGGVAFHSFYQASFDYGNTDIIGNSVSGCDRLFSFMSTLDTSAMRVRILGNAFKKFRGVGRFNMSGIAELTFKGNSWSNIDTATPSSIDGNTARESRWDANAGTYGRISVEGESFAALDTSWYFAQLALGALALDTLSICNNNFGGVYDSATTGASFSQTSAGATITNLWVKNNLAAGNLGFAGTHTNEWIEGNTFTNTIRGVTGTTVGNRITADQILKFRTATSKTIPGATSHSFRNAADGADNLLIADAGTLTARGAITGLTGVTTSGALTHTGTTVGLNGNAPVAKAAAITAPTAPSAAYVQAEATSMKTAVDAIRVALQNIGITL